METLSVPERLNHTRRADYTSATGPDGIMLGLLRPAITQALASALNSPAGTAIDVGCGQQPFRAQIERAGWSYLGMDATPSAQTLLGIIDQPLPLELKGKAFALLLCTEVLEHVRDWNQAFSNLAVLAAPGAKAIITCPFMMPLHEEPYDFWRPTRHALASFAQTAGFRVAHYEALGSGTDVLRFVLGYSLPKSGASFQAQTFRKALSLILQVFLRLLESPWLTRHVTLRSPLHLSHFLVLERV